MADLIKWTDYMNKFPFGGNQLAIGRQFDHGGMTIYSAPTKTANLYFIDGIDTVAEQNAANFRFNHNLNEFQFLIQQLPKVTINTAGELTAIKFIGDGSELSGVVSLTDTDELPEGVVNLYYTDTRADNRISLQKGAVNGLATLGPDSKIPSSQLPPIAISDTFVVASQAAMLALVAERGDVAVRTDVTKTFILQAEPASNLANWIEISTASGAVLSVNSYTGAVVLATGDISESGVNYYYTETRFNTSFNGKTTDNLTQGSTNKYYSTTLFSADFNARVAGTTNTLAMFASTNTIGDSPISKVGTTLSFDSTALLGKNDDSTVLGGGSNRFTSLYLVNLIDFKASSDFTLAQNGTQMLLVKNSTGNVRIGSGSDNGSKLQVKGTNNSILSVGDSSGFVDRVLITSGASNADVSLRMARTAEEMQLALVSTATNVSDFSQIGDLVLRADTNSIILSARSASGKIKFGTGAADTKKMELSNGGQLAINEDSNDGLSGFKFLVNGSARINSLGIGTTTLSGDVLVVNGTSRLEQALTLNATYMSVTSSASPGLSTSGNGRIYFDSTANKFKVSEHAGAFVDLLLSYTPVNKAGDTMTGTLNLPSNGLVVGTNQIVVTGGRVLVGTATDDTIHKFQIAGGFKSVVSDAKVFFGPDKMLSIFGSGPGISDGGIITLGRSTGVDPYTADAFLAVPGSAGGMSNISSAGDLVLRGNSNVVIASRGGGSIKFSTNAPDTEKMRLTNSGRLLLGTTTDNTVDLLQVNGTGIFNGLLTATNLKTTGLVANVENIPTWYKFTVSHTALQTAALTNDIELFQLPSGGVVHAVKVKHTASFTGGTIATYTLSVGIVGNLTKYTTVFDVFQATGNTVFQLTNVVQSENHGAATSIRLAAISTGANLNQSTTGSVDVWVLVSKAI